MSEVPESHERSLKRVLGAGESAATAHVVTGPDDRPESKTESVVATDARIVRIEQDDRDDAETIRSVPYAGVSEVVVDKEGDERENIGLLLLGFFVGVIGIGTAMAGFSMGGAVVGPALAAGLVVGLVGLVLVIVAVRTEDGDVTLRLGTPRDADAFRLRLDADDRNFAEDVAALVGREHA